MGSGLTSEEMGDACVVQGDEKGLGPGGGNGSEEEVIKELFWKEDRWDLLVYWILWGSRGICTREWLRFQTGAPEGVERGQGVVQAGAVTARDVGQVLGSVPGSQ